MKLKGLRYFVCLLTSRAWLVLWKAHVYVTEAFLVMLCEYDCFPLLPSQDSTTVVLFLFTSCRGRRSNAVRWENMSWITEQQCAEYRNKLDHSWRQTWLFWLAVKISHLITTLCCKHRIKHTPSWSRAHSRQSRWSQTQRLSGQTHYRSSLRVRLGPCHRNTHTGRDSDDSLLTCLLCSHRNAVKVDFSNYFLQNLFFSVKAAKRWWYNLIFSFSGVRTWIGKSKSHTKTIRSPYTATKTAHTYLLEARHMQAEDEIVIIWTTCSTANVVPCNLPSWTDMMQTHYTSLITDVCTYDIILLYYPKLSLTWEETSGCLWMVI